MDRTALTTALRGALLACVALIAPLPASAVKQPLPGLDYTVDLQRYAGDWFVQGSIPVGIPFFSDAHAANYTERYELNPDGTIRLICEFDDAKDDFERRRYEFKGFVTDDPSFATWKVQFVWPLRATYQIIYLDDDYRTTIVATPNRRFAWIMSRDSRISEDTYAELLQTLADAGYDPADVRRIPHG